MLTSRPPDTSSILAWLLREPTAATSPFETTEVKQKTKTENGGKTCGLSSNPPWAFFFWWFYFQSFIMWWVNDGAAGPPESNIILDTFSKSKALLVVSEETSLIRTFYVDRCSRFHQRPNKEVPRTELLSHELNVR